jgi:hypothetical protein
MRWLIWRQHRAEAVSLGLFFGAVGALLFAVGLPMHASFHDDGVDGCLAHGVPFSTACVDLMAQFSDRFASRGAFLPLFGVVPFAIGAFLGASLLSRELETGTWQLAWTQAVPRMRWLALKVVTLATLTVALTGAFAAITMWYRQPLDALRGRFETSFDIEGLAPLAYGLFAFALATAAGGLLRRSLPALAASFAAFIAVRGVVTSYARPHYQTPVTVDQDASDPRDWLLGTGLVDSGGHRLTFAEQNAMNNAARAANADVTAYLHDHGISRWDAYQPAARFWTFQYIETGIFVALAVLLLALAAWQVKRRAF